jgi:hypothetical protein
MTKKTKLEAIRLTRNLGYEAMITHRKQIKKIMKHNLKKKSIKKKILNQP